MKMEKKLTIKVSENELNWAEDYIHCWLLCKKHNSVFSDVSDAVLYAYTHGQCKKCTAKTTKGRKICWSIISRLFDEMEKK
jgi:hypothetical protein